MSESAVQAAVAVAADCVPVCAGAAVGVMVIARPSLENVAITGTDAFTVITAEPLFSL